MNSTLDRLAANLAILRASCNDGVGSLLDEAALQAVEREYEVILPTEYRCFLERFGDLSVGPGNVFRRVGEGLSARSKNRFPLSEPFLGTLSPAHQELAQEQQWNDYGRLLKQWERIPKQDGVLAISDYGCAIYGVLILNGPDAGKVWIQHADTAYYGPFGGSESLHDESFLSEWTATNDLRDYSFLEWYESWLDARLKIFDPSCGEIARIDE
jgi:hypothetical protein